MQRGEGNWAMSPLRPAAAASPAPSAAAVLARRDQTRERGLEARISLLRQELSQQRDAQRSAEAAAAAAGCGVGRPSADLAPLHRLATMAQQDIVRRVPPTPPRQCAAVTPTPTSLSAAGVSGAPPRQRAEPAPQPTPGGVRWQATSRSTHDAGSPLRPDPVTAPPPPGMPGLGDPIFSGTAALPGGKYSQPVQVSRPLGSRPPPPQPAEGAAGGGVQRTPTRAPAPEPERQRRLWCPVSGSELASPQRLRPAVGSSVEITGLRSRRDLNERQATVVEHDEDRHDGVIAQADSGETVSVYARNLRWQCDEDAPRPPIGTAVRLLELRRRPDLSGKRGVVVDHDPGNPEGLAVQMDGTLETVQLRSRSVQWLHPVDYRPAPFSQSAYLDASPQRSSHAPQSGRSWDCSARPPVGAVVTVRGAKTRPDLIGRQGTVLGHDPQRPDGVAVDIGGEVVNLRSRSLAPPEGPGAASGRYG